MGNTLIRGIFVLIGGTIGGLTPMVPFALICLFAAVIDSISAWRLARRVKKHYPNSKPHDKFESEKFFGIFSKMFILFSCIILAFLIDSYIFPMLDLILPNIVAGAFCFYEMWSILENESSENPRSWAKLLQKIMINKASKYVEGLSEALEDLKKEEGEKKEEN